MTREQIVEAYEKHHEEIGQWTLIDAETAADLTANELGIEVEEVRRVMIDYWAGMKG